MENGVKRSSLESFIDRFEEAESAAIEANEMARTCRKYYNGDQLTDAEILALKKRGHPQIVINLVRKEINWMRGYEMQSRVDPKAFPRNPNDEDAADAATDALRFVADNVKYDKYRSQVWEGLVIEGLSGVEVIHEFKPPMKEPKIVLNRYNWDRLFADPHSSEPDYSDARYKGAVVWSDMDELIEQYPDKKDDIEASIGSTDVSSEAYEDRPYYTVWSDKNRRRVRVVLMYYREKGTWKWARFTKGSILGQGESPYVDEDGNSVCPLIMQSMYVSEDNTRHGVVKDFLDPQDEVNARRAKLLHHLNSRQTWGPKGAVASVRAMKAELAKADGHVEVNQEAILDARESGVLPFNIIQNNDQAAGQMQLYQESKANIEVMGANSALQGNASGSSGRAIMAEQQGGLVEIAPVYSRLLEFDDAVYTQMWMRVRQLWTQEKWIRVTDDDKKARFVGLNQPVTLQEVLSERPPEEVRAFALKNALTPGDPRLQSVVSIKNNTAEMAVDIVIDDVPDAVTLQGETFEQLVNLATSMPGAVPPEILIESAPNLDRSIKDKLIEHLEQQKAQQAQAAGPQMQAEQRKTMATAQKDEAQAQKYMAEARTAATPQITRVAG